MKAVIFLTTVLALSACSNNNDTLLDEYLLDTSNSSTNTVERYKACMLLSVLPSSEELIEKVKNNHSKNSTCNTYLLAKYRINQRYTDTFINNFPEKDALKPLWAMHSQSGYILGILPSSVQFLSELAKHNDDALDKLVSAIPYSDGALAESLVDIVSDMYIKMPKRVDASFERVKLNIEEVSLIKETSEYKMGL